MEPEGLADDALLNRLQTLVRQEREDTAGVVAHLREVDRRDLVRGRGYPSLFEYCVKELKYSEPSAYLRIRAARSIKKKPHLLALLQKGDLHLWAIVLLHPYLDSQRADGLIQQARGKTKREVEALLAPYSPRPQSRDTIRVMAVEPKPAEDMSLFEAAAPTASPKHACSAETVSAASAGQQGPAALPERQYSKAAAWAGVSGAERVSGRSCAVALAGVLQRRSCSSGASGKGQEPVMA